VHLGQHRRRRDQPSQQPGGDGVELADVAEGEHPKEGAQRGRGPHPGEQSAHPAVAQQVHVIDGIRAADHPGDQGEDLRRGVRAALGPDLEPLGQQPG
jgi:hypothetical protein